ncbi:MAG TPA: FtsX-like permease family protein [Streptosporangiaceae bacterium]|nr:FtsX-like permease family protein [Streptosporangiaceae bacterium]
MKGGPVLRAVRGGVARRRVQTFVIGLVLLVSTGASVLALALVVDSSAPFDTSFTAQHGAHLAMVVDTGRATRADLAATRRLPGVTGAAGPFAEAAVALQFPGQSGPGGTLPPMTLAGRSSPGGPVDQLTLQSGHWAQGPGQMVLASNPASDMQLGLPLGQKLVVTSAPGHPVLTVVGLATSVTNTASGWVTPGELARLRAPGAPAAGQMLYRFRGAGTTAQIGADTAAVSRALPAGSVLATESYLTVKASETSRIGPFVPFLVAFGVIGLVMSVLIVANVVSGAVVAGYRRIGILKSIGFTPGQVVAAYTGQVTVSALIGVLGGLVLGDLLAMMLLHQAASAYGVGTLSVPLWVDVAVPLGMLALVGIAALLPSVRAGRLSAVQAIAAGRAPRPGHGYAAHRLLGRLRLPRPVTIGLAAPFARPARTMITLVAVLLGATAVTFAVGLSTSLNKVVGGLSLASSEPVQVFLNAQNAFAFDAAQQRTVQAALRAQPGTRHYAAETDNPISVAGLTGQHPLTAFRGPSAWTGYPLISGHWYTGPGQAVVSTGFLTLTGKKIGDDVTIVLGTTPMRVRIVGEDFDSQGRGVSVITDWRTLAAAHVPASLSEPDQYDVGLRPGVSAAGYAQALGQRLGTGYGAQVNARNSVVVSLMLGLIGTLTLLLALVAGLGVLNTIVLHTRERVHDLGVFRAVGMTPRQTIAMVICWVAGTGLLAGVIAVPAGMALHRAVLPAMASAANLGLPASYLAVYRGWELALLALAGVVIATAGALLPAGWAARMRTASALHAE